MMNFDAMISPDNDAAVLNTANVVTVRINAHRVRELVHNSSGRKELVPEVPPNLRDNVVEIAGMCVFKCFQRAKEANK